MHEQKQSLILSVFSGYFVQDAGDIILTGHARGSWEFLLHHALVRQHAFGLPFVLF